MRMQSGPSTVSMVFFNDRHISFDFVMTTKWLSHPSDLVWLIMQRSRRLNRLKKIDCSSCIWTWTLFKKNSKVEFEYGNSKRKSKWESESNPGVQWIDIEFEAKIFYEHKKTLIEIGNLEFWITYDLMRIIISPCLSLIQIPVSHIRCQIIYF